jgi:2'-5' RNA ligase
VKLFIAVYPPEEALDDLQKTVDTLNVAIAPAVRLTERSLWHITLAFLGEVEEHKAPEVMRAVDRAAEQAKPSPLRLAGGGRFGRGHTTVIYAGVAGDIECLTRTAASIRHELTAIRIGYDQRRFTPHLTIARPGAQTPGSQLADDLQTLSAYRGPQWTATSVAVVESQSGPPRRYDQRHKAALASGHE